jgi:hypothetical protein
MDSVASVPAAALVAAALALAAAARTQQQSEAQPPIDKTGKGGGRAGVEACETSF